MKVKKLAQSTLYVTNNSGNTLLIDPGKYNIENNRVTLENFPTANAVIITHKHADHFDITILRSIFKKSSPKIFTNKEIEAILRKENISSNVLEPNNKIDAFGFNVITIKTDHIVNGEEVQNFGLVVSADNSNFYNTSDTLFMEPSLLPEETHAKYLFVPISNRGVTMGINEAVNFANNLKPKLVIPVHYDSPKDVGINLQEFVKKAEEKGLKVKIMSFGEEILLD